MKLNRRRALTAATAVVGAVVLAPVAAFGGRQTVWAAQPPAPHFTSDPPDQRSPEQLWDAWKRAEDVRLTNILTRGNTHYRYVEQVSNQAYARIKELAAEKGITLDIRVFDGKEVVVRGGNVITIWQE